MGPETEEHMMQVAGYIDQKMMEIRKNSKAVAIDSSLAYILTSINVANDYFKEVKHQLEQEDCIEDLRLQIMSEKAKTAECRNSWNTWNGTKEDWNGNCRNIRRKKKPQMRGSIPLKYVPEKDKI